MRSNKKLKGFTLVELVVVVCIIGALTAVLAPNMLQYYRSSRVKECNSDAKLVFNATQTEVQKHISMDRANAKDGLFADKVVIYYQADGTILFTGNTNYAGYGGAVQDGFKDAATCSDADLQAEITEFVNKVNTTVSDGASTNWAVYVDHYIVKSCAASDVATSRYIGKYSAKNASGDTPEAREMADETYESFMGDTAELLKIANDYYGS